MSNIPVTSENKIDILKQNIPKGGTSHFPVVNIFFLCYKIHQFHLPYFAAFSSVLYLERHAVSCGPACLANCTKQATLL